MSICLIPYCTFIKREEQISHDLLQKSQASFVATFLFYGSSSFLLFRNCLSCFSQLEWEDIYSSVLFTSGVHHNKINKLALVWWCHGTANLSHAYLCMSVRQRIIWIDAKLLVVSECVYSIIFFRHSSGIIIAILCTALATSAATLRLQTECINSCFLPKLVL